jgi:RND family efflux transporter MFP subunit
MNWKKVVGITTGIVVVAIVVFKLKNNKEAVESKVFQYDREAPVSIEVDTIDLKTDYATISFSGVFEPNKESKISAEQPGKINVLFGDVGSYVKKGQTLIALDNSLLKLQLQSVEVQIEGLEKDVNRYTILTKADAVQGLQLEKAELALRSARVQQATVSEQISKTMIKAPFDGIITAKLNEVGAFAAPGIPLLQITDISQLKFTIQVSQGDLKRFELKQAYNISIDALPGISAHGEVVMIGSKANAGNSFPVQLLLRNTPDMQIKSGMFGKVHLSSDQHSTGISLPASAIVGSSTKPQVYLVKHGKAVLQHITIAQRVGNSVSVSTGLNKGDVVVTSGFINLFEGANVSIH